ncbi:MAG TPA: hypothetical protein V6D22_23890 [Candidatus Obscuribacterales bacterium]
MTGDNVKTPAEQGREHPKGKQPDESAETLHRSWWDVIENAAVKPFANAALVDSYNAAANGVNFASGHELLPQAERWQVQQGKSTLEWGAQTVCGALGSLLPYTVAGGSLCGVVRGLRTFGAAEAAGAAESAMISAHPWDAPLSYAAGGAGYDGLRTPGQAETHFGNALGGATAIFTYGAGFKFAGELGGLRGIGVRALTPAAGTLAQLTASDGIAQQRVPTWDEISKATASAYVVGSILPHAQKTIDLSVSALTPRGAKAQTASSGDSPSAESPTTVPGDSPKQSDVVRENTKPTTASEAEPRPEATDSTGRPLSQENDTRIAERFKPLTAEELTTARAEVERDLSAFKATDTQNIRQQLDSFGFKPSQRDLMMNVLAEIREHHVAQRGPDGLVSAEQKNSYIHALGEFSEGLFSAQANGLPPERAMKQAIGAALTDSVKAGWSREMGGNFFTHHLDGALAADHVLQRYLGDDITPRDVEDIKNIILEHQIGPPIFMGFAYTAQARGQMSAQREKAFHSLSTSGKPLTESEQTELSHLRQLKEADDSTTAKLAAYKERMTKGDQLKPEEVQDFNKIQERSRLGKFLSDDEVADLKVIEQKIGAPYSQTLERDENGRTRVQFSDSQRNILRTYVGEGTENWYVPSADSPWYKESQGVISADSLDNYFPKIENGVPVKGPFKIAALRGPISVTPDTTLDSAIASIDASAKSTFHQALLSHGDLERAHQRMESAPLVYNVAKQQTESWLRNELSSLKSDPVASQKPELAFLKDYDPNKPLSGIPYWDTKLEGMPAPSAPASEKAAFAARPDVQLADRIHKRFVLALEQMRSFSGEAQTDFESVRGLSEPALRSRAEAAQQQIVLNEQLINQGHYSGTGGL